MLENKNAVITGANRGIGKTIVQKFAENGCKIIWACARTQNDAFEAEMKEIGDKYNTEIIPVYFDLSEPSQIMDAVKIIRSKKASVDILVNSAGVVHIDLFAMTSMEKMRNVFEVNFFAPVYLTQLVSKLMIRQKSGNIINISSIAGLDTHPTNCTYGSSKAALISFSRILASELAPYNIRVNTVAPGPTDTDMVKTVMEKVGNNNLNYCAMERLAKPEEVANVVMFLASEQSSFLNGEVIRVDGGEK